MGERASIEKGWVYGEANFLIGQIATGIFRPGVSDGLMGTNAGVAIADIEITTGRTTPLDRTWTLLETSHERVRKIAPNVRKWPFTQIAECVVPPEGVRVHIPQVVYIGDIDAGRITTPLPEAGMNGVHMLGKAPFDPVQQINSISITVARSSGFNCS